MKAKEFSVSGQVLQDPSELEKYVVENRTSGEKVLRVDAKRQTATDIPVCLRAWARPLSVLHK